MTDGSLILLIFDPGCRQMKKLQTSTNIASLMHLVRNDINSLTARQYQILSVHGLIFNDQDHKVIRLKLDNAVQSCFVPCLLVSV